MKSYAFFVRNCFCSYRSFDFCSCSLPCYKEHQSMTSLAAFWGVVRGWGRCGYTARSPTFVTLCMFRKVHSESRCCQQYLFAVCAERVRYTHFVFLYAHTHRNTLASSAFIMSPLWFFSYFFFLGHRMLVLAVRRHSISAQKVIQFWRSSCMYFMAEIMVLTTMIVSLLHTFFKILGIVRTVRCWDQRWHGSSFSIWVCCPTGSHKYTSKLHCAAITYHTPSAFVHVFIYFRRWFYYST